MTMTSTVQVKVDGVLLETGNYKYELAGFIGDTLATAEGQFPQGEGNLFFPYLYGFDVDGDYYEEPGFSNNNRITWKLYNHETQSVEDAYCATNLFFSGNWVIGTPSNPVVLNFFTGETCWEKVTTNDLQDGDVIVITSNEEEDDMALSEEANSNKREVLDITRNSNGTITWEDDEDPFAYRIDRLILHKFGLCQDNQFGLFSSTGYLCTGSNSQDQLRTRTSSNANCVFEFEVAEGNATITGKGNYTHNVIQYDGSNFVCMTAEDMPVHIYRLTTYTAPSTYTVTVTAEEGGTAGDGGEFEAGSEVTVNALADDCYVFAGWKVGEEIVSTDAEYTFTVTEDVELTATFELVQYNVTYTASLENVATLPEAAEVNCGETVSPEYTITNECYEFVNWTVNGEEVELPYTVSEDVELVANFVIKSYNVTYSANLEDVATLPETAEVDCGETVEPEYTITNECYEFVNWTVNGEEVELPYTVNEDVELVANFVVKTYNVTYAANVEDVATLPEAAEVNCGETVEPEYTITDECYEFVNWTVNGEEVELPYEVTADVEFVANFVKKSYNVTYTANPAEAATMPEAATVECGETVEPEYTITEGYEFANWTVNGEEVELPYTVNEDVELVANFNQIEYTVTLTANPAEGGTATIAEDGPYHYGDVITLTAEAAEGYQFVNFTVGNGVVTSPYTVTEDVEILANFILEDVNTYAITVTANPEEGGTVTGAGTYAEEEVVTLSAVANTGYDFINWTLDNEVVSEEANLTITVLEAADYVANFELQSIEITVIEGEGGTVTGAGIYTYGDEVTVEATPAEGYRFVNFTCGDMVVTDNPYTFTATEALTIEANFELIPEYTVNVTIDPEDAGTVTGAGTFAEGTEVTLTATAGEEYLFEGWYENGEPINASNPYIFNLTEDRELTAKFVNKYFTLTTTVDPEEGGAIHISVDPLQEEGEQYQNGSLITCVAEAAEGYQFVNWECNAEDYTVEGGIVEFILTSNVDVIAHFELIPETPTYMVTYTANPAEGGTLDQTNGAVEENTEVTVTATANEGYEFIGWTVNGEEVEGEENVLTFTVTEATDVVANFEEITVSEYTVTLHGSPVAGGTLEGAGTYEEGTTVTVIATPNEGYNFVSWTKNTNVVSEDPEYSFEVTEDVTLVANFELIPVIVNYMVTFEVNPEEAGTVDLEDGEYEEDTDLTVTATAAEGYQFLNWTINGEVAGEDDELTFTVTEDMAVVANFELIPVIVEYNITIGEIENGTVTAPATSPAGETITVTVTPDPMYVLTSLYYYTTDPEETTAIDLVTKQFVMPEADVTIGAEFMLVTGKGDVNLDGEVNILDVLAALNYILDKNPQPFDFDQADMNEDGVIDISDVMAINALILGLKGDCEEGYAVYEVIDNKLYIDANMALAGYQFRLSAEPAVIDMPGFATAGNWSNGEYIFVVYNLSGEKASGLYAILDLGNANVSDVVMATKEGCKVRGVEGTVSVNSFDESAYNVFPVPANEWVKVSGEGINQVEVYNAMGQRVMVVNDINGDETNINVTSLTPGSYFFRINTNNGVATKSVIVVR